MSLPTVYIADDHQLVIDGLKLLIDADVFRIAGTAINGDAACKSILAHKPDIALLDLRMPGLSGLEVIQQLNRHSLPTRCIILSMHDRPRDIRDAMNQGAAGYLLKNAGRSELMRCLTDVWEGKTFFPKALVVPQKENKPLFTPREAEIIKLGLDGITTLEMAKRLHLSARTVETHRKSINNKTNSKTPLGWSKFLDENRIELS